MTYSTFQGKLPVVNFLEFENKIEIEIGHISLQHCSNQLPASCIVGKFPYSE